MLPSGQPPQPPQAPAAPQAPQPPQPALAQPQLPLAEALAQLPPALPANQLVQDWLQNQEGVVPDNSGLYQGRDRRARA